MQNLSNRFSPHLFFNLLGSVSGDAGDPEKVKQQVSQVAQLLRMSLEHAEHTAVSLSDELDMVKSYVELQRSRIPQPFFTDYEVGDDVNKNTPIPSMILQIPVENAIRHGLMPLEGEKNLKVLIRKVENAMEITIEDNGIGREKSKGRTTGTGTGLKVLLQTIRLLNQQNNEQITFRVIDGERCGTIVRIGIPDNYNYQLKTA
jgi:LytS/YehU family sensor histidine kinase